MSQQTETKSRQGRGAGIAIGLVALIAGVLILGALGAASRLLGIGPWTDPENYYPPCEMLPTYSAVDEAYTKNSELSAKLKAVGPGVRVERTKLCGDQDKGAITVWYSNEQEDTGVTKILNSTSFGVMAVLRES